MSGRPKIKVFEYSLLGKFLTQYKDMSSYKIKYFNNEKYPIFIKSVLGIDYTLTENTIAFKQRVHRDDVKFYIKVINSDYLRESVEKKPIEILNILGERIAIVCSEELVCKLMPHISAASIYKSLRKKDKRTYRGSELTFNYVEQTK